FLDWQNPIIGHMQHNLRDPSRDREHGRIYRITYEGRPLSSSPKMAGEPIEKLLDVLKHPEDRVRYRARIELGSRDSDQVLAATKKWLTTLDPKAPNHEHHLLEALWLHQAHNVVEPDLLKRVLASPEFRARAAATRVLCYWRDGVPDALEKLRVQINDSNPRVRLEAVRALSFFNDERAVSVALEVYNHPDDEYIRFVLNETLNTLERQLKGPKIDRQNIAATLLTMIEKGKLPAERQAALLETVCRHGSAKELQTVWDRTQQKDGYPTTLRKRVLGWLTEAADTRRVQPKVEAAAVQKLLSEIDPALLPDAVRLATAWKVKEAGDLLRGLARDGKAKPDARQAAIDGLAILADAESGKVLRELTVAPNPAAIRFRAASALAQLDLTEGANAAARALSEASDNDDPAPLIEAFLLRKNGSDQLAAALEKQKISQDAAKRMLRAMYLAGRNDLALGKTIGRLAGVEAAPKPPTVEEMKQLLQEVQAKGDAARGELVFHRADLGCLTCHAIHKAGGNVGPDLGPIGSSSPVDYVLTSILDPNQAIKEEYLTRTIITSKGQIVTGIVTERNKN
ncbi:MAG: HEAT repeat domain-containing protein, partial [Planctomycetia bacterium]|nr:HEAT repeat domain-containing protein [Planctomycetia bacterium]